MEGQEVNKLIERETFQKANDYYAQNHQAIDIMYDFVQEYNKDMSMPRDYGTGKLIYSMEAHILRFIRCNPGTTVTEIANYWKRTKATVSPQISKLERCGYIYKRKDSENSRNVNLYLTEKGVALEEAHQAYDEKKTEFFLEKLRKLYSNKELEVFYEILNNFKLLFSEFNSQNPPK